MQLARLDPQALPDKPVPPALKALLALPEQREIKAIPALPGHKDPLALLDQQEQLVLKALKAQLD